MIVNKNGIEFNVDPSSNEFRNFWLQVMSGWENETFKNIKENLKHGDVFFDVGAWIGPITLFASKIAKDVYSFEPDETAFNELTINLYDNRDILDDVHAYRKCINDVDGEVDFGNAKRWGNSGSSMLTGQGFRVDRDCDPNGNWKVSTKVEGITLESFFKEKNIEKCDFIKMDIEGGETKVIPSLKNIFETYKPVLYLSMHTSFFGNFNEDIQGIIDTLKVFPITRLSSGVDISLETLKNKTGFYDILCKWE